MLWGKRKQGEGRESEGSICTTPPTTCPIQQVLSVPHTLLAEPCTTASIFPCDILVESSTAPRAILPLRQVPAGGPQAGVGISHPWRCLGVVKLGLAGSSLTLKGAGPELPWPGLQRTLGSGHPLTLSIPGTDEGLQTGGGL